MLISFTNGKPLLVDGLVRGLCHELFSGVSYLLEIADSQSLSPSFEKGGVLFLHIGRGSYFRIDPVKQTVHLQLNEWLSLKDFTLALVSFQTLVQRVDAMIEFIEPSEGAIQTSPLTESEEGQLQSVLHYIKVVRDAGQSFSGYDVKINGEIVTINLPGDISVEVDTATGEISFVGQPQDGSQLLAAISDFLYDQLRRAGLLDKDSL